MKLYIELMSNVFLLCRCSTKLGRPCNGGRRTINLASSCAGGSRRATPAHEIMHSMGRYHEQTRPDRDRFVNVIKGNIQSSRSCKLLQIVFTILFS